MSGALVLLHGWGFDSRIFAPIEEELARHWTVHAIDLPGHGRSTLPFGSLDALCERVSSEMPEEAIVCGWSLGGLVAQRLVHRRRDKVRALALVSSTPCFVQRADWPAGIALETLQAFGAAMQSDARGTLRDFVRLNALDGKNARAVVREVEQAMRGNDFPGADTLAKGLDLLATTDLRSEASSIDAPTVVIHGSADRIVPVEAGEWLARRIPHARWTAIPAAAHLPFLTHPAEFVGALEELDA